MTNALAEAEAAFDAEARRFILAGRKYVAGRISRQELVDAHTAVALAFARLAQTVDPDETQKPRLVLVSGDAA